jgi:G3E family GTPase
LFRSKGFIWLSNYPNNFFEWSHAGIQIFIEGAVPWTGVIEEGITLEEQAASGNIGARKQQLVFIG